MKRSVVGDFVNPSFTHERLGARQHDVFENATTDLRARSSIEDAVRTEAVVRFARTVSASTFDFVAGDPEEIRSDVPRLWSFEGPPHEAERELGVA